MKKLIYLIVFGIFLFACKPNQPGRWTNLPEGWDPVPEELIKSYFPVKNGDILTYISDDGTVAEFRVYEKTYYYDPCVVFEVTGGEGNNTETIRFSENIVILLSAAYTEGTGGNDIGIGARLNICSNRTVFEASVGCSYPRNGNIIRIGGRIWETFEKKPNSDMPLYPNKAFEYLTDTIYLPNYYMPELGINFVIVRNVGIAWFIDDMGVKWTLQQ